MSSDVELCNIALSHIGISKTIASLTELSKEASMCSRFLTLTRDLVLRDYKWPFATKIASLALVASDPNDEWAFSYRYPSDCMMVRRIVNGIPIGFIADVAVFPTYSLMNSYYEANKVPYKIAVDSSGKVIWCSLSEAQLEYTVRVTADLIAPPDFELCVTYRLATFIAPSLTAGDPNKLGAAAMQSYLFEAGKASNNAYNEEQATQSNDCAFTRARE